MGIGKSELKKQLQNMGIKIVAGEYVRKKDIQNCIKANSKITASAKTIFLVVAEGSQMKNFKDGVICAYSNKQAAEVHKKDLDNRGQDEKVWKRWPSIDIEKIRLYDSYEEKADDAILHNLEGRPIIPD
jgi:hypothetical protein